jgi:lipopolysaccharide export system permease protein
MKIITRYMVRSHVGMIANCMGAFISIYLVIDFLERYGKFSRAGAPVSAIALYFLCKIPEIVFQTTPMAVLMGTILAISSLAKNSEITAMRSSGASLVMIGRPLLATAGMISILLLIMQEFISPAASEKMRYIDQVVVQKKSIEVFFRHNNIWHRDDNLIMKANLFTPENSTLSGVTIWEIDSGMNPVSRTEAATATHAPGGWLLHGVTYRHFSSTGEIETRKQPGYFSKINLMPADLKVVAKSAEDMGFTALRHYCKTIQDNGYDATSYRTLMHAKISLPFAALIMAFLGIPFSLRDGRSGGIGVGIVISIVIGFSYFVINALILSLGQHGVLPPIVAAWTSNLIFAGAGLWFTLTMDT